MLFEQMKPGSACQWRSRKDIQPFFSCGFLDKSHCTTDQTNFITDHYTLVVILNGRAEYETADGTVHMLKTGDFFQRIPGIAHTTRIDPDSRYFEGYVVMGALFYEAWKDLGILPFPHPVGHCRNLMEATEQMQTLRERIGHGSPPDAGANALLVQQVILNILADTKRENPNRQLLDKACCSRRELPPPPRPLRPVRVPPLRRCGGHPTGATARTGRAPRIPLRGSGEGNAVPDCRSDRPAADVRTRSVAVFPPENA